MFRHIKNIDFAESLGLLSDKKRETRIETILRSRIFDEGLNFISPVLDAIYCLNREAFNKFLKSLRLRKKDVIVLDAKILTLSSEGKPDDEISKFSQFFEDHINNNIEGEFSNHILKKRLEGLIFSSRPPFCKFRCKSKWIKRFIHDYEKYPFRELLEMKRFITSPPINNFKHRTKWTRKIIKDYEES